MKYLDLIKNTNALIMIHKKNEFDCKCKKMQRSMNEKNYKNVMMDLNNFTLLSNVKN